MIFNTLLFLTVGLLAVLDIIYGTMASWNEWIVTPQLKLGILEFAAFYLLAKEGERIAKGMSSGPAS